MLQMTQTIEALRYVNFEKSTEFKQRTESHIDVRIGSKDMYLNIVGFLIKSEKTPYCIKNKELIDVNIKFDTIA